MADTNEDETAALLELLLSSLARIEALALHHVHIAALALSQNSEQDRMYSLDTKPAPDMFLSVIFEPIIVFRSLGFNPLPRGAIHSSL